VGSGIPPAAHKSILGARLPVALTHHFVIRGAPRQAAFLGGQLQRLFAVELGLVHQLLDARRQRLRGIDVGAFLGRLRGTDDQRDFAAGWPFFKRGGDFREFAAEELLVELGDFASQARGPVAQDLKSVCDALGDAMWRFVENQRAILDAQTFQRAAALAAASGKEANEEKFFARQSRSGKGSEQRRRSWNRHDRNIVPQTQGDEPMPRIGDQRHTSVAHERDFRALLQGHDQFRRARQLVVFVIADQRLVDVVVSEQFLRMPCILAGDLIGFFQDAQRAKRDVLEVADRRPDQIEAAAGCCRGSPRRILRAHAEESSTRSERLRRACYNACFEQLIGEASLPLYEYKCLKCGRTTEKIESVSGPHLKRCPHCGGKVESVITAPAIQFKGAGWYVTDYAGKSTDGGSKENKPVAEAKDTTGKEKETASKEGEAAAKDTAPKESKEKRAVKKK